MSKLFFPTTILIFLIMYFFSGRIRVYKIVKLLDLNSKYQPIEKALEVNLKLSILIILGSAATSFCYCFLPDIYKVVYHPMDDLDIFFLNYAGYFLIRISLIWLIISSFWISKILDDERSSMNFSRIRKIEMIALTGVALLTGGVFIFISSVGTLLQFFVSVFFLFSAHKRLKKNDYTYPA